MSALLGAELLKLRTTRMVYGFLGALLLIVAIATVAVIASTSAGDLADDQEGLFATAVTGVVFVLLLGVMLMSGEFRHGTITQTLLITPVRWRVLAAKVVAGALLGVGFGVVSELFSLVLGAPLLVLKGVDLSFGGDAVRLVGGTVGAMGVCGALGVAVGSLIRNQVVAIIGVFAWLLIVEPLLVPRLGEAARFAPGEAIAAMAGDHGGGSDLLSPGAGVAVAIGYVLVLAAAGGRLVFSRDVSSIQA